MPERLTKSCTKLSYNRLYQKHLGSPKEEDETCLICTLVPEALSDHLLHLCLSFCLPFNNGSLFSSCLATLK